MRYTVEDGGRLNNYAVEPKMYAAEPPSQKQKQSYVLWGGVAIVLVGGLIAVTLAASHVA
ncbi:MAG: photosystem II assembly protein Psb34 [Prochlorotrichaceae cyanobacterium]|jgi:hypothetical protein